MADIRSAISQQGSSVGGSEGSSGNTTMNAADINRLIEERARGLETSTGAESSLARYFRTPAELRLTDAERARMVASFRAMRQWEAPDVGNLYDSYIPL